MASKITSQEFIRVVAGNDSVKIRDAIEAVALEERHTFIMYSVDEKGRNAGHFAAAFGNEYLYSSMRRWLSQGERKTLVNQKDWNDDTPVTCIGILTPPWINEPWPPIVPDKARIQMGILVGSFELYQEAKIAVGSRILADGGILASANKQNDTAESLAKQFEMHSVKRYLSNLRNELSSEANTVKEMKPVEAKSV
ncbi:MAG: hypothetical protein M1504_01870 [Candidatus Marsarchaeota archaeon]|nr:hypothetical protein [Candidatus Marsarchaeota archaeon]